MPSGITRADNVPRESHRGKLAKLFFHFLAAAERLLTSATENLGKTFGGSRTSRTTSATGWSGRTPLPESAVARKVEPLRYSRGLENSPVIVDAHLLERKSCLRTLELGHLSFPRPTQRFSAQNTNRHHRARGPLRWGPFSTPKMQTRLSTPGRRR